MGMAHREVAPHFARRSDDGVEVGILGAASSCARACWLARMLRESCPRWLLEVPLLAERPAPRASAAAWARSQPGISARIDRERR